MLPTDAAPKGAFEQIVLVTRRTRLEDLCLTYGTRSQAKFLIEHAGGDFQKYVDEDDATRRARDETRHALDLGLRLATIDRDLGPTFRFLSSDVVVTVGQDGLVANIAKYALDSPIVAVNPDPARNDGILLPFLPAQVRRAVSATIEGTASVRPVTLAEAALEDGQRLLAFNDLFLGARTHVSARYRIRWAGADEAQSSSGVLVSTGVGSTGWLSSVFNMAAGVAAFGGGACRSAPRLEWEDPRLMFVVREPFASRHSQAGIVAGLLAAGQELVLESHMPSGGVVFSDGVEEDFLRFESGAVAHVRAAAQKARLVVG